MSSQFSLDWEINSSSEGKLIRHFLKEHEISKTALTDIKFKGGKILVNAQEENVRYILKANDLLTVIFPPEETSDGLKGEKIPLDILYEDEYLLVVNKPANMNTIPSREHPTGSLANALVGYYQIRGIPATAHIVTRLDRDTSGIVLIAKHRHVHHLMSKQQKAGQVKRMYEALASGGFPEDRGTVNQPIGRRSDSIIEREVREDGQYACTHYRVIQRFKGCTHIVLRLETGRTHQIRVHMAYLGHPLLGDDLYGGERSIIQRQALHCKKLTFIHPFTKFEMSLEAPMPDDMISILKRLP
ncbi:RluA family pseudouridine synthase [Neobacillus terrae]|uniref:RluA family pseudouridine synthase n=1 Tax=Neobacillus terrae TaxID=3034837 RepID=UPI001407F26A|nr:RluA family pseudouridine synthase [Neobacillus terrae]NHM32979.1 RluA family pseudouridine synthase [Neobacillus terrae]